MDDTALDRRGAIGDDLAYLRAAHPRDGWRSGGRLGDLGAFWLGVHDGLRGEGGAVMRAVADFEADDRDPRRFAVALAPALNAYLGHLHQHHRIEDVMYFPKFRRLDPRMAAGFDLLDADHHQIHAALETVVGEARSLVAALDGPPDAARTAAARSAAARSAAASSRLVRLADRHLADEEEIVVPALLEHGEAALDRRGR